MVWPCLGHHITRLNWELSYKFANWKLHVWCKPQYFMWTQTCQWFFQVHSHDSAIHIMGFKQPNIHMFGLLVGGQEINNHCKTLWAYLTQKSKVNVVDKHLTKVGCTFVVKVFFTNVRKSYLVKSFFHGNFTLGCN